LDFSSAFSCRHVGYHYGQIEAIEFSNDGTMLASGGYDTILRLWPVSQALDKEIVPFQMEKRHNSIVLCLAIASDNSRLFSGGQDMKILIHDVQT
jgi:WD repeat-containing protein 22